MLKGSTRPNKRQLSDSQLKQARLMRRQGKSYATIAEHFAISETTIRLWLGSLCNRRKKLSSRINRTHCEQCGISYISHTRCKYCTRLIHSPLIDVCKWCNIVNEVERVGQCILCDVDNKATQASDSQGIDNSVGVLDSTDPVGRGN